MGRGLSWSGQLPLLSHLFESLLALSGSSNKHTIKNTHSCTHVALDLVTYLVLLLGLLHCLEKGHLSTEDTVLLLLVPAVCQMIMLWPVIGSSGGREEGKTHNLFKQNFYVLVFVKYLFLDSFVMERDSLYC